MLQLLLGGHELELVIGHLVRAVVSRAHIDYLNRSIAGFGRKWRCRLSVALSDGRESARDANESERCVTDPAGLLHSP